MRCADLHYIIKIMRFQQNYAFKTGFAQFHPFFCVKNPLAQAGCRLEYKKVPKKGAVENYYIGLRLLRHT